MMPHPGKRLALAVLGSCLTVNPGHAASVLMVSIDGMKPEYVTEADQHGLKVPYLRSLMVQGSYARGVQGVWPSVTYPSHTTLLTGVTPAEHGVANNLEFDPSRTFGETWFWYASQVQVPTLWTAAHAAGLSTASIGWPVSVGASAVDTLIPEFWRINRPTSDLSPSDRLMMAALSRPDGVLRQLESHLGPYMEGNDPSPEGDAIKNRFALEVIRTRKPRFMTLHFSALDEEEHGHGPFSAEANAELEILDGFLQGLDQALHANDPGAAMVVVSDHGFLPVSTRVNLYPAFIDAGLLSASVDARTHQTRISAWKATLWGSGGMGAVMLNAPADAPLLAQTHALLQKIQADPRFGVAEVLDQEAIRRRGGYADAAFVIVMKPGFTLSNDPAAEPVQALPGTPGGHGFSPDYPDMRSAFFAAGSGIAKNRDLGQIDMRQIAPTVAQLLNVSLPSARAAPLNLRP